QGPSGQHQARRQEPQPRQKRARGIDSAWAESNLSAGYGKSAALEKENRPGPVERPAAATLALTGLKARIGLVDDENTALAPDNLVVPVARTQRFQRVTNFHHSLTMQVWRVHKTLSAPCQRQPDAVAS